MVRLPRIDTCHKAERIDLMKEQSSLSSYTSCHSRTETKIKRIKKYDVKVSFDFSDLEENIETHEYLSDVYVPSIYIAQSCQSPTDDQEEKP